MNQSMNSDGLSSASFEGLMPGEILRVTDPQYRARALDEGPHANQLWLLEQHGHMEYAMVMNVDKDDPRLARVMPISNDPTEQTATGLIIDGTPIGIPLIAWPSLAIEIPVRLFDTPLGDFNAHTAAAMIGDDPDANSHVARANDSENVDDLLTAYAIYAGRATVFQHWWNIGRRLPPLHRAQQTEFGYSVARREYMRALGTVLKLKPTDRNAVMRGELKLTKAQQKRMDAAGFVPAPPQWQEEISDEYLIMAEQPYWRMHLTDLEADAEDNGDVRLEMAHMAAFSLAARTSGHGEKALRGAFLKAIEQLLKQRGLAQ